MSPTPHNTNGGKTARFYAAIFTGIGTTLALILAVAAGTYAHAKAVEDIRHIRDDLARMEIAQQQTAREVKSLERAYWALAVEVGHSPKPRDPQNQ